MVSSARNARYIVSEWNQWLVPAPRTIIERPRVRSALRANSRAIRAACPAGTDVIASCQAGVAGSDASSYEAGQRPGSPGRSTPYCASIRSKTVVTRRPPIRRTGTPRTMTEPPSVLPSSNRGRATATVSSAPSSRLSAGTVSPRSRFQRPGAAFPQRKPSEPFGTTGSPVTESRSTVLDSACSVSCPRSAAVRNPSGTRPRSCSRRVTRNGASVYVLK
ncbi:hypothetical protein SMF913_25847 [Streptomyces malaysiensis]|uniref:Uncharacterized protein n=1 Tax=Streptomyces malaysiensis TaxID=92644 RepID=A0A2J7YQR7_STRMQ|nr:hypothetical protein SMF913_25847 [Streptomyces malaysiensis]